MPQFARKVLVLDSRYEPSKIVSMYAGFVLIFTQRATCIIDSDRSIRGITKSYPVPWIIRLNNCPPKQRKSQGVRFSRQNVYLRDNFCCQYCSKTPHFDLLTMDHVIPISKRGKTSWENIVTSCKSCNIRKGARNLEDAGFRLKINPVRPDFNPKLLFAIKYGVNSRNIPEPWLGYLDLSASDRIIAASGQGHEQALEKAI